MTLNHSHEIGTKGNWSRPLVAMYFDGQFCFSYFGRRSFSDHFYQIILNSDHWFQKRGSSKFLLSSKPCPLDHISFSYFVEGHLVTTSAKLF